MPSSSSLAVRVGMHAVRVGLVAAVALLLRWQHAEFLACQARQAQELLPLETVRAYFPAATATAPSRVVAGGQAALAETGEVIGTLLQTSPLGDRCVGFSGPTNLLLACDAENRVTAVAILASRDTREHVRQVREHPSFLASFAGRQVGESVPAEPVAAVSGATLTSYAIAEAIALRLGGKRPGSLKFSEPVTLAEVQLFFPAATEFSVDAGDAATLRVRNERGEPLGWLLRTSPAADNLVGYQGPTDTLVAFSSAGQVIGLALRKSYDNEPYVGYVRDEASFHHVLDGKTLPELARGNAEAAGIEGVSGATMTSVAVAKGIFLAAQARWQAEQNAGALPSARAWQINFSDLGAAAMVLVGTGLAFSRWRRLAVLRYGWLVVVVLYLGLSAGTLVSQAMLVGWSQTGVRWNALGLVFLTFAAFALPLATKRNVYCSHLCPHGALQQLALRLARPRWHLPLVWRRVLAVVPAVLLAWCLVVGMWHLPFSLVDVEPFDAYIFNVSGWAAIAIAVGGLVASCFVPMAYCRYGCPTGALLEHVRYHSRCESWTRRDTFALSCVVLAAACYFGQKFLA